MEEKIIIVNLSKVEPSELQSYFKQITETMTFSPLFNFIGDLSKIYPNIKTWFKTKVEKELEEKNGSREVLLAFHRNIEQLVGIAILKKEKKEKKICTIRVHKDFLKRGIGTKLFEKSIEFLNDTKPMITISEDNVEAFKPLLKKFGFKLVEIKKDLYVKGKNEYIYNQKFIESEPDESFIIN